MGLSDEQRAMLRLVGQRGEAGYADVAALKGMSVEEVRAQVAEALAQLDDEGGLSGAAPEQPAAATAEKPAGPKPAPQAEKPSAAPPPPPEPKPPRKKPSMPSGTGLRAAIAAGVIVVALIVIVILVSSGGGGDSTSSAGSTTQTTAGNRPVTNSKEVTKAILAEVDGSGAQGVAIFGRFKNKLALELAAEGLEPTPKGTSYTVWLAASPRKMLPLASTAVPQSGKIGAQFEVPVEVLAYLANETFGEITVTRTEDSRLETALASAAKAKEAPEYTGEAVLSGPVTGPVVGAANK